MKIVFVLELVSFTKKHYFPDVDIDEDLKNVKKDSIRRITKRHFEIEYEN